MESFETTLTQLMAHSKGGMVILDFDVGHTVTVQWIGILGCMMTEGPTAAIAIWSALSQELQARKDLIECDSKLS